MSSSTISYSTRQAGPANSLEYRLFIEDHTGKVISPFHDIPVWAEKSSKLVNMIVEIPRWTTAKMEVCKEEPLNPIKQDVKKGALRHVKNIFPHHGYPWNYGAIPQTWECPDAPDHATGLKGDNDPVDAVEIGSAVIPSGSVITAKVLGVIALIDEGETDWKVLVINVADPLSQQLHNIDDVRAKCPGLLEATHRWFRDYKIPDGKPKNEFAFDGEYRDASFACKVIEETHEMWSQLVSGKLANTKKIALASRLVGSVTAEEEAKIPAKNDIPAPNPLPASVCDQVYC
jgi:inorganic pyrophosphatase